MDILLGLGGSELGYRALEETIEAATAGQDTLTVALYDGPEDASTDAMESRVRDQLATAGIDTGVRVLGSDPASRLVELAESEEFDRLVLGGGRRSPLGKIQFDAVTEFVLLNASTTITLVR